MIEREEYTNWLVKTKDNEFVKIITGVRRSGKSVILDLHKKYLQKMGVKKENIIYYNFEELKNLQYTNMNHLYERLKQQTAKLNGKIYFMFDEIQEVENWQKLVNGLRLDFNSDIYITGSNNKLLSGKLFTYLVGRTISLSVFPLSFKEFVGFNKNYKTDKDLDSLFTEYIKWGGFPMLPGIKDEEIRGDVLDGIYSGIILKDLTERPNIREIGLLDRIVSYLLDTIGSTISIKKISDALTADGIKTNPSSIDRYISLLKNSFVFYEAQRYDIKGKSHLKTLAKYYTVDTGIRNNTLGQIGNVGFQLENIIFIELKRRGYEVFVGKLDSAEIDFVCFKGGEIEYIQVAYQLPQDSDREQRNLLNITDNYKKTIITLNRMNVGNIEGIPVVHAVDWLLN